jgi:hypothetical protein
MKMSLVGLGDCGRIQFGIEEFSDADDFTVTCIASKWLVILPSVLSPSFAMGHG